MVVIGDLMEEEELLTINHKGKSKRKDCLFVCLFCLCGGGDFFTFGTIYIHHHCYPPSSPLKSKSITKKNSKVKVPQSSASQQEEGNKPVMSSYHSFEITSGSRVFGNPRESNRGNPLKE
jgi:hypothetical protein